MNIQNRYDCVLLFDVKDRNPNGDPDAGNLPRLDTETGQGLATDCSIKRKIRNFVGVTKSKDDVYEKAGYDIYVKEKAALGARPNTAFMKLGISPRQDATELIPDNLAEQFDALTLPEGMEIDTDEDGRSILKKAVGSHAGQEGSSEMAERHQPCKAIEGFHCKALRNATARKPKQDESKKGREQMCQHFYDFDTFGAVLLPEDCTATAVRSVARCKLLLPDPLTPSSPWSIP